MKTLTFFAIAFLLLGCSTKANYPSEWTHIEARDSSGTCSKIYGQHSQYGTAAVSKGPFWNFTTVTQPSLFSDVLGINADPPAAITHFSINISDTDPSFNLWVGNELFLSRSFELKELNCKSGNWQLNLDWTAWRSSGILLDMGGTFTSLILYPAEDGSLIIRENKKMIGTAVLLPVYIQEQEWHRFLPLSTNEYKFEANAPNGVLSNEKKYARLLPPPTQKDRKENHEKQDQCLTRALEQFEKLGGNLTSSEEERLAKRSTQAFLVQRYKNTSAYPRSEYIDKTIGHTPSTKSAQLRKPHWLDPSVTDRYVLCLFDAGYVWEDVLRTTYDH